MIILRLSLLLFYFLLSNASLASRNGPEYFDVLHYRFDVFLNDTSNVVAVQAVVRLRFPEIVNDQLTLDLHGYSNLTEKGMLVEYVLVNQQTTHFHQETEEIAIDVPHNIVTGDTVEVALSYKGVPENGLIISKNKYGERTFFADHWPDRAHYWLSVVDHPAEKATCEFRVSAPIQYQVVANGDRINEVFLENGYHLTHWKERNRIPAKVMVIGVADFTTFPMDNANFSTAWVYESTGSSGAVDFQEGLDIYKLFKEKMGSYPFSKLDHVESTTLFYGMENAGNIFYDEKAVTGEGKIGGLIAHEVGHQWFGNSVTEANWNDVWLSESFAEYFQNYYIERKFGVDSLLQSIAKDEIKISKYENEYPEKSIRLKRVDMPKNVLSPLVYEKGARVLRMLNYRVGEDVFWEIMRAYYEKYKFDNATTKDFIVVAEEISENDLSAFFTQWLDVSGKPDLSYSYVQKGKKLIIEFVQNTEYIYDIHLDISVKNENGEQVLNNYDIEDKETTITIQNVRSFDQVTIDPLNIIYGNITFQ